jgi:carbohydrate kinase (thermoresistant glucokinase family)
MEKLRAMPDSEDPLSEPTNAGYETMQQGGDVPAAVVIMGVSGAGKSIVGRQLAKRLGWEFTEGDTLHPPENVAKMSSGQPLTDADRAPWLTAIARVIESWARRGEHGVVTCSALKCAYRRQIIRDHDVRLVYLNGSRELIAERIAARQGHFMPASLLNSQFAALEPPGPDENPITVRIDQPVERVIANIVGALGSLSEHSSSV